MSCVFLILSQFYFEGRDGKSHKQLSKTLSKDLKLDVESIGNLLLFCPNVGKYCFTDTFYYVHNSVWINLDFVRVVVVHKMSMVKMILQASGFALLYARISSRLV